MRHGELNPKWSFVRCWYRNKDSMHNDMNSQSSHNPLHCNECNKNEHCFRSMRYSNDLVKHTSGIVAMSFRLNFYCNHLGQFGKSWLIGNPWIFSSFLPSAPTHSPLPYRMAMQLKEGQRWRRPVAEWQHERHERHERHEEPTEEFMRRQATLRRQEIPRFLAQFSRRHLHERPHQRKPHSNWFNYP